MKYQLNQKLKQRVRSGVGILFWWFLAACFIKVVVVMAWSKPPPTMDKVWNGLAYRTVTVTNRLPNPPGQSGFKLVTNVLTLPMSTNPVGVNSYSNLMVRFVSYSNPPITAPFVPLVVSNAIYRGPTVNGPWRFWGWVPADGRSYFAATPIIKSQAEYYWISNWWNPAFTN